MRLRTVAEHRQKVLDSLRPNRRVHRLSITEALGAVLAEPMAARVAVPRFDNAAMDGYAVRHQDLHPGVTLPVVSALAAGIAPMVQVLPGTAVRIMTGAGMPPGADTVVPIELTDDGREQVTVRELPAAGRHVRKAAEDVQVGDLVAESGMALDALSIAALAATGVSEVPVVDRPRVAVVATGNELRPPGTPLGAGQIPESNSLMIAGLVREAGGEVVLRTSAGDDRDALGKALQSALSAAPDLVVLSGGVSVGDHDVVRRSLGGDLEFVQVAMSPGRPQGLGHVDQVPVIAVPGNPVAAAVSVETFVRPAVLTLAGRREINRSVVNALASAGWTSPPGREQYMPVRLEPAQTEAWAHPIAQGSHRAGSLAAVEGWAVVRRDVTAVRRGDRVQVLVIR